MNRTLLHALALVAAGMSLYCVPDSEPMNLNEESSHFETQSIQEVTTQRPVGLDANDQGSQVGSGRQIRIRGNNSLAQGNEPIIYVDGVRIENGQIGDSNVVDMINPDDIDRIEIVKGPAALKLYGTEGANGVIQIFKKRGGG